MAILMVLSTQLRRAVTDKPHASDHNSLADSFLGIVGARHLRVGYDGVAKNPIGGAVLSTGNFSDTLQNTAGNHMAILKAATTPTATPSVANSVLLIQDAGITSPVDFTIASGKKLQLLNAANTNSVNLYHSGTNDVMETDDSLIVGVDLAVTRDAVVLRDIWGKRALNIGSVQNTAVAGAAWLETGMSVGTFSAPGTGQILASAEMQATRFLSTVATGTAPLTVASTTNVANLNASYLQDHALIYYYKAPVVAKLTVNYTLTTTMTTLTGPSVALTPGDWLVTIDLIGTEAGAADVGNSLQAQLTVVSGSATIQQATSILVQTFDLLNGNLSASRSWAVNVTANATIGVQANKVSATAGTSLLQGTLSTTTATYQGGGDT